MQDIPVELLEKELRGMEVELSNLRQQHKVVTDSIFKLEQERCDLICKINSEQQLELPL